MSGPDDLVHQIAALPIRWDRKGELRVLMVTSRDTGRWVMPKGWHMSGKKPWAAAEIEALEEAGAVGYVSKEKIGVYHYIKKKKTLKLRSRVTVYPMFVEKLKPRWKERKHRRRHWFSPKKAARLVKEEELSILLRELAKEPRKQPAILKLLKA